MDWRQTVQKFSEGAEPPGTCLGGYKHLGTQEVTETRGIGAESGKNKSQVGVAEVFREDFAQHGAVIRGESHLTRRLFGPMVRGIAAWQVPSG